MSSIVSAIRPMFQETLHFALYLFHYRISQIKLELPHYRLEIMYYDEETGKKHIISHSDIIRKFKSLIRQHRTDKKRTELYFVAMLIVDRFYYHDLPFHIEMEESAKIYFTLLQEHTKGTIYSLPL
jgi:hypothetical protein